MEFICQIGFCLSSSNCSLSINFLFHLVILCYPEVKCSETRLNYPHRCNDLCPSLNKQIVREHYTFNIINRIDDLQPQVHKFLIDKPKK